MTESVHYIHGTDPDEQARLDLLNRLTNDSFVAFLDPWRGARALDVGVGLAGVATLVAQSVGPEGAVAGIDHSAQQVRTAQERVLAQGIRNIELRQGDACALHFADASFDLCYTRYVLEHVQNPLQVAREMRRVTRAGGKVCAQENDLRALILSHECPMFTRVWERFCELQVSLGGDPYVGRRLHALWLEAGFTNVSISVAPEIHWAASPQGTFAPWVQNLIGNVESARGKLVAANLSTAPEIDSALGELTAFQARKDAACFFYWNRVTGTV